jgi:hypothetical protein
LYLAREQIWLKPGFQEQLILFGLCQYAPSPDNAIYRNWRQRLDEAKAKIDEEMAKMEADQGQHQTEAQTQE